MMNKRKKRLEREREEEEEGRGEMGRCGARRWKEREGVVASGREG